MDKEDCSFIKKKGILSFMATHMELQDIVLGAMRYKHKHSYHRFSLLHVKILKGKLSME
jgi:hypothetical protein